MKYLKLTLLLSAVVLMSDLAAQSKVYVDSLKMDIYEPTGDTSSARPVILLSHAGSFLPPTLTQPSAIALNGTRGDSVLVELCTRFAKRGFVAVSFEYRLGWNPSGTVSQEIRTATIVQAVYRAMQDAKAAIRYLKLNASTYKIDTDKIVLGGTNSGAYVALAAGNLNRASEITLSRFTYTAGGAPFIDTLRLGDFDGDNGNPQFSHYNNPGVSSEFQLVLSLGGNVGDTSWLNAGEPAIIAFHGVSDVLSPYNTGTVFTGAGTIPIITVSGPGHYIPKSDDLGNQDPLKGGNFCFDAPASTDGNVYEGLYPFYGAGFEPWAWYDTAHAANPTASRTRGNLYIDTIMNYSIPRIYKALFDANYTETCPAADPLPATFANVTKTTGKVYGWNWSILPTAEDQTGVAVGIAETKVNDVNVEIYPNPSSADINIRVNDAAQSITAIELFDIAGKLVRTEEVKQTKQYTLSNRGIEPGVYFVNIKFASGDKTFKRVVFE